jgi:hypothetical protein
MENETSNRMKLRFSLKTLFVGVTLVAMGAGWTMYSLDWIKQRNTILKQDFVYGNPTIPPLFSKPIAPGGLWIFGERGQHTLRVSTKLASKKEIIELRRLFPESILLLRASIVRVDGDVDLEPGEYPK